MEVTGRIIHLWTVKPDGWCSGIMAPHRKDYNSDELRFAGVISPEPKVGMRMTLTGDLDYNSKYGPQLKVTGCSVNMQSEENILAFLKTVRGIGNVRAADIIAKFGQDTIAECADDPAAVLAAVGVSMTAGGRELAERLGCACRNQSRVLGMTRLAPSLPFAAAAELEEAIKKAKDVSYEQVETMLVTCPYRLLRLVPRSKKLNWELMDTIALQDLQWDRCNEVRLVYCINEALHVLSERGVDIQSMNDPPLSNYPSVLFTSGNGYVNLSEYKELMTLLFYIQKFVGDKRFDMKMLQHMLQVAPNKAVLKEHAEYKLCVINGESRLCLTRVLRAEQDIVRWVNYMNTTPSGPTYATANGDFSVRELRERIALWEQMTGTRLSSDQVEAVILCLVNRLSILTGGPGYGKTMVLQCVADVWEGCQQDMHQGHTVVGITPTGMALKRLRMSIGESNLGHGSQRLFVTAAGQMVENRHDRQTGKSLSPIRPTLCVCDEMSMLTIEWAHAVLEMYHSAHVIFIGDPKQLPSIGPAEFTSELLNSGKVATAVLSTCHRSTNAALTTNAENCYAGMPKPMQYVPGVWELYPEVDEDDIAKSAIALYQQHLAAGCDVEEVSILAATHKYSAGVSAMNGTIQNLVNPERNNPGQISSVSVEGVDVYTGRGWPVPDTIRWLAKGEKTLLRLGDKIVITDNDYDLGVVNGDQGTLVRYEYDPSVSASTEAEKRVLVIKLFGTGKEFRIPFNKWDIVELAYATTIHKAQGSEYDHVIVTVPERLKYMPGDFACRNLMFTALSRAKKSVQVVGSVAGAGCALETVSRTPRYHRNCNLEDFLA